jgi:hypothetical protein
VIRVYKQVLFGLLPVVDAIKTGVPVRHHLRNLFVLVREAIANLLLILAGG